MNKIKMIIVYISPGGQANYMPCCVEATPEDLHLGKHYSVARKFAKNLGREVVITIDQSEPLFQPFSSIIHWDQVESIEVR